MKAIITRIEILGKDKTWRKIHFVDPITGTAGSSILPAKGIDETKVKITSLADEYSADVDIDFNPQGRVDSVTPF